MTAHQIAEYEAYYEHIAPFGEKRADIRNAILCCVIANSQRNHKTRPFRIKDFMPKFAADREAPQTEEQMKRMLKSMCSK